MTAVVPVPPGRRACVDDPTNTCSRISFELNVGETHQLQAFFSEPSILATICVPFAMNHDVSCCFVQCNLFKRSVESVPVHAIKLHITVSCKSS